MECVDAPFHPKVPRAKLIEGAIYCVDWVGDGVTVDGKDDAGLRIVGDPLPSHSAWRLDAFRPIYRPKRELIEDLSMPVDIDYRIGAGVVYEWASK